MIAVTGAGAVAIWNDSAAIGTEPDVVLSAPGTEGAVMHPNGKVYASGAGALLVYDGTELVAAVDGHPGAHDVIVGSNGTIWIASTARQRVVQYDADLNELMVLEGPEFGLIGPRYLDMTEFGELLIVDQDAHRVLKVDPAAPEGSRVVGVLGDGAPGLGPMKFDDPEGIVIRGTRYWISDSDNNRIVRYSVVIN